LKTEVAADGQGNATLKWEKVESWRSWSELSEGRSLLRSNVSDWTAPERWQANMQLAEAENACPPSTASRSANPA
jgi:hypothetical protein